MALEKPSIGGTMVPLETFEAFADIPQNRVLMAEKLTAASPVKPEIVEGLTTIEQVFEHFKPKVEMDFETEEGTSRKETLNFLGLGDFGVKGITAQSDFLLELTMKREQYQKIIKQLKSNKQLKQAINDAETKQSLINSLQALIKELEAAR
jgi:hypothetical protein